jgi:aryl-alcohol dehydrogenase-like predicted oxidoreductase
MQKRPLGHTQWQLNPIGFGCMGLSEFYGPPIEPNAAIKLLHQAIDWGVEHFDTAEMYGIGASNEALLGQAFADRRDRVFIATKFGPTRDFETGAFTGLDGSRSNCRRAIEGSLQRLRTDHVDLYYLHRVDPAIAIEETIDAMASLVKEGKVGAIGLSEASANTIRRAAKVHPIAAVQSEYSIFSRDIEAEVIPACLDVGATLVAYSPLGRGLLTGRFKTENLSDGDWRSTTPRFQGDAFGANLELSREIEAVASTKGCTAAQVALAWVLGGGTTIMALTGTTKLANLQDNLGASDLFLSPAERSTLNTLAAQVRGDRYDSWGMATING